MAKAATVGTGRGAKTNPAILTGPPRRARA